MPIQMTRAEYEAKFGVKAPDVAAGSVVRPPGLANRVPASVPKASGGEASLGERIGGVINKAGGKVHSALTDNTPVQSTLPGAGFRNEARKGIEATAAAFRAVPEVAGEFLPKEARNLGRDVGQAVAGGFNSLTDMIGSNKTLQEFVMKNPKIAQELENTLRSAGALGSISGDITTIAGGTKLADTAVDMAGKYAKGVMNLPGKAIKGTGKAIYNDAFDPSVDEAQKLVNFKGKRLSLQNELKSLEKGSVEYDSIKSQLADLEKPRLARDTAIEKGYVGREGDIGIQAKAGQRDLWRTKLEPTLKNSGQTMTKDELFARAVKRVTEEVNPTRKDAFNRALEALYEDYDQWDSFDLLKANELKSSLAKFTPAKIFKGQDIANEMKTLQADMASAIRDKTYNTLPNSGLRNDYIDYGNLKKLEGIGVRAMTSGGFKGGFGGFWSALEKALLTPVKTVGGQVLYKVGDKLIFTGPPGLTTFQDYLKTVGMSGIRIGAGTAASQANNQATNMPSQ